MDENPYRGSNLAPTDGPRGRRIPTIVGIMATGFMTLVLALILSPGGDPYSMILYTIPLAVFGLVSFFLGRRSG